MEYDSITRNISNEINYAFIATISFAYLAYSLKILSSLKQGYEQQKKKADENQSEIRNGVVRKNLASLLK